MYIPRIVERQVEDALKSPKVLMLLGARQVGKTTMMERIMAGTGGVIYNMDIEVDKARLISAAHQSPLQAMESLGVRRLFVIDEAQRAPEVGRLVKGWYDAKIPVKIVLLGSSSLDLLDRTAESLTGRNEKMYLPPLLWREIVQTQAWYPHNGDLQAFLPQVQSLLLPCMVFGGYPETVVREDKEKYLLNLTSDYLLKDILQSDVVKRPEQIKKLLLLLAYQVGSEVSLSELATNLGMSRQTVEKYMELLERIFVIFRLSSFGTNPRKEIVKRSKVYFWDTGVRNALLKEFTVIDVRSDIGSLFENWVVAEAAKRNLIEGDTKELYFWRTADGNEVDLVIRTGQAIRAIEIKWRSHRLGTGKSFLRRYGVAPEIITKDSFWHIL